jgi:hypothetical protein
MITGHVAAGVVVDNAQVIGQLDALNAEFSSRLSHLSKVKKRAVLRMWSLRFHAQTKRLPYV